MRHFIRYIFSLALCIFLVSVTPARAESTLSDVSLHYASSATARDTGPADGVFDTFLTPPGSVLNNGFQEIRTAIEFDISAIPSGSTIESATLTLNHTLTNPSRNIQLHGYTGDGSIIFDDFSQDGVLGTNVVSISPTQYDATSFIQTLVNEGDSYAGFNLREASATGEFNVLFNIEDDLLQPVLDISYGGSSVETLPVIGWDLQDWDGDGLRSDIGILGFGAPGNGLLAFGYLDETGCDNATDGVNCIPIAMDTGAINPLVFTAGTQDGPIGRLKPLITNACYGASESGSNAAAEIVDGTLTFQALDLALLSEAIDPELSPICAGPLSLAGITVEKLVPLDTNKWGVIVTYTSGYFFNSPIYVRLEGIMTTSGTSHAECIGDLEGVTQERDDLQEELDQILADYDGDGVPALRDDCEGTAEGENVDIQGCSIEQFCTRIVFSNQSKDLCNHADYMDDEGEDPKDCKAGHGTCIVRP